MFVRYCPCSLVHYHVTCPANVKRLFKDMTDLV